MCLAIHVWVLKSKGSKKNALNILCHLRKMISVGQCWHIFKGILPWFGYYSQHNYSLVSLLCTQHVSQFGS